MGQSLSYVDYAIIRYAEVLLNFAEATFELNGSISDADLDRSINLLRARGGVAPLTNSLVSNYTLSMREEIRRERRVELAMEGFRYWDLLRWKQAENELPQMILGAKYFEDEALVIDPNWNPMRTQDGFIITEPATNRNFNPDRDYLWPLPLTELSMNPNLVQNPNWN
jgi:hypothetical protein